ncbi:MAG: DUF6062 family protein [Oscillospiraceae bacterium]|nr:DUF6062 family protein [Oscillospiraceae bacterium]
MKETIYTIPINEAFDRRDGCPLCKLLADLEQSSLEYTMGASMMEPDVRIKTNEQGFCRRHMQAMLAEKNKLSFALMIESHLPELDKAVFSPAIAASAFKPERKLPFFPALVRRKYQRAREAARGAEQGCFICGRVGLFMGRYLDNMLHMWRTEPDFRVKFGSQPFFCVPHYADILARAEHSLPPGPRQELYRSLGGICQSYLAGLNSDISEFCKSFDYRQVGRGLSDGAKTAVERAKAFLTGVE